MKFDWQHKHEGMFGRCYLQDKLVVWMNGYCFKVKNLITGTVYSEEFYLEKKHKMYVMGKLVDIKKELADQLAVEEYAEKVAENLLN